MLGNHSVEVFCLNPGSFDFVQKIAVELGFPWVALQVTNKFPPSMICCWVNVYTEGGSEENVLL